MTTASNVPVAPDLTGSLLHSWNIFYHSSNDKNWTLASYQKIAQISTFEDLMALNEHMPENMVKYGMLFVMKTGIDPVYEDERNKHGGYFSFKVSNKVVVQTWKNFVYGLCGETIVKDREWMKFVNGVSISPKKNFCILKIWMENLKNQNPGSLMEIPGLSKEGVLFTPFSEKG